MKCKLLIIILLLSVIRITGNAQIPNWGVNENNFQYTMTFLGFLNVDGVILSSTNDKVGAFVNGECRGVANLIYESSQKRYYAYLTVFANIENEVVNFKIFDATNNVIKSVVKTVPFAINNHYGSLLQAYCFTNTTLSSSAELTDVNFVNATRKSIVIANNVVNLSIDKIQDITNLNTTFTISPNASLFLNGVKMVSGSNAINFSNTLVFRVRSQDESVVKDWTINLSTPVLFYKKNVVCYAKGAIKVQSPKNGEIVTLSLNGQVLKTLQSPIRKPFLKT